MSEYDDATMEDFEKWLSSEECRVGESLKLSTLSLLKTFREFWSMLPVEDDA